MKNSNIKKMLLGEHPLHDQERDAKNYKYISINILTKCNNKYKRKKDPSSFQWSQRAQTPWRSPTLQPTLLGRKRVSFPCWGKVNASCMIIKYWPPGQPDLHITSFCFYRYKSSLSIYPSQYHLFPVDC